MSTRKVARSSVSGRFVTREYARRYRGSTQVETVSVASSGVRRPARRRAVSHSSAETDRTAEAGKALRTAKEKKAGNSFKAGRDL